MSRSTSCRLEPLLAALRIAAVAVLAPVVSVSLAGATADADASHDTPARPGADLPPPASPTTPPAL